MANQVIEPTREEIPIDQALYQRMPQIVWSRSYERYETELNKRAGQQFKKKSKKEYKSILAIYFEELMNELKQGIAVWLPHQIGLIELGVYRGFLPTRRKEQARTALWFHILWKKRDGVKYPGMYNFKVSKDEGYRMKLYYDEHPGELMKLRQL